MQGPFLFRLTFANWKLQQLCQLTSHLLRLAKSSTWASVLHRSPQHSRAAVYFSPPTLLLFHTPPSCFSYC